jgi:NAD(P)-dependent dehydrogenase (short-subunit alcohol dehydrogenase family)
MRAFEGKVALVVGATSGIGRATAVAFAREGAKVVVAGRREREGNETVRLILETGNEGIFVQTNVTIELEVEDLVHKTVVTYGRLDCAFNNAGTIGLSPLAESSTEDFQAIIDTNVKGMFFCLKYEIARMLGTGGGAIVNMSSLAGLVGSRDRAVYSAGKHAVIGLTKSTATPAW